MLYVLEGNLGVEKYPKLKINENIRFCDNKENQREEMAESHREIKGKICALKWQLFKKIGASLLRGNFGLRLHIRRGGGGGLCGV